MPIGRTAECPRGGFVWILSSLSLTTSQNSSQLDVSPLASTESPRRWIPNVRTEHD